MPLVRDPSYVLTPLQAHLVERVLEVARQEAVRDGRRLQPEVLDLLAGVRFLAEWYRAEATTDTGPENAVSASVASTRENDRAVSRKLAAQGDPDSLDVTDVVALLEGRVTDSGVRDALRRGRLPGWKAETGAWLTTEQNVKTWRSEVDQ